MSLNLKPEVVSKSLTHTAIVTNWESIQNLSGKIAIIQEDPNAGFGSVRRENASFLTQEQIADMYMYWVIGASFANDEIGELRRSFVEGIDLEFEGGNVSNPGFVTYARRLSGSANGGFNTVSINPSTQLVKDLNSNCGGEGVKSSMYFV